MRVHHLNCGELRPAGGPWVYGKSAEHRYLVCHCVLLELDSELVLIDAGLGLADMRDPRGRLGWIFETFVRPRLDDELTALRQVERLGFQRRDVRHIILTHMDLDHAGGLSDFPEATVHVLEREYQTALRPRTVDRTRYSPSQWAHGPSWARYDERGEPWLGFRSVRDLEGIPPEVLLVPLPGHSRGHTAVAIDVGDRWLLHCGDAYYYRGEVDPERPRCPPALDVLQRFTQSDGKLRLENQVRLRELAREHHDEVDLFCAHDADEYERMAARKTAARTAHES